MTSRGSRRQHRHLQPGHHRCRTADPAAQVSTNNAMAQGCCYGQRPTATMSQRCWATGWSAPGGGARPKRHRDQVEPVLAGQPVMIGRSWALVKAGQKGEYRGVELGWRVEVGQVAGAVDDDLSAPGIFAVM